MLTTDAPRKICAGSGCSPSRPSTPFRKGLVCLEASDGDKRSKKIRFTEEGRKAARQVTDALFDMESRIWDRLGGPSTEDLLHVLALFNQFMKEEMTCEKDLF